jgi:hypothetical protein
MSASESPSIQAKQLREFFVPALELGSQPIDLGRAYGLAGFCCAAVGRTCARARPAGLIRGRYRIVD